MNERDLEVIEAVRIETMQTMLAGVEIEGGRLIGADDARVCIASTRLALDVLGRYGIFGRPLKVHVRIYPKKAWEWQQQHQDNDLLDLLASIPGATIEENEANLAARGLDPKTRMRFCGYGTGLPKSFHLAKEGWLNGHVVALIEDNGEYMVLDTSAEQFTTSDFPKGYRIFMEPIVFGVPEDWARDPGSSWVRVEPEVLNGGAILYRQPNDLAGVFDADDWKILHLGNGPILSDGIQRRVEDRLTLMRL